MYNAQVPIAPIESLADQPLINDSHHPSASTMSEHSHLLNSPAEAMASNGNNQNFSPHSATSAANAQTSVPSFRGAGALSVGKWAHSLADFANTTLIVILRTSPKQWAACCYNTLWRSHPVSGLC
jgi:hypothetical protein